MKSLIAFGSFGLLAFLGSANATDNSTDLHLERMVVRRQDNSKVAVYTTCKKSKQFALTFDDGPYAHETEITKTLDGSGAKGTFFVNGYNWGCIYSPDNAQKLLRSYQAGHEIASHTWSHPDITTLTDSQFNKQLDLVEKAMMKIIGVKPAVFRPPYGKFNDANLRVLKKRGYSGLIGWDFDSGDTSGKTAKQSIAAYKSLANSFPKQHIALNHETKADTAKTVIPQVVKDLKNKGYKLVTVSECLGIPAYQSVGQPKKRDSSWTCDGTPAPGKA